MAKPISTFPYDDNIPDSTLQTPHPELQAIFDKHGIPPTRIPTHKTLAAYRKGFAAANVRFNNSVLVRNALGCNKPDDPSTRYWSETDHTIRARDGHDLTLRIYKPKSLPRSGVPVVVLTHGGGWIMGDLRTEATVARLFCTKLDVLVVNVDFRNYPEAKFGQSALDCHDAVRWTAKNIANFGGNCELGFILAGMSGGGTYASIVAHLARDEGLTPRVTGQWLSCPVLSGQTGDETTRAVRDLFDTRTVNRSWEQHRDAPLMNRAMSDAIVAFADYEWGSPLLTPFLFAAHDRLGAIYVQVAGIDPWRDGGRIYAGLCGRAGAPVRLDVYPGLLHCWWTTYPMLKVSQKWIEDSVAGLLWLLVGSQCKDTEKKEAKL